MITGTNQSGDRERGEIMTKKLGKLYFTVYLVFLSPSPLSTIGISFPILFVTCLITIDPTSIKEKWRHLQASNTIDYADLQ